MAWVRLDDQVPQHPKILRAGPSAAWLWVCGIAYGSAHLTDGVVPQEALQTFGVPNAAKLARTLVAVGLWEAVEGGYRVHDYHQHNPSASDVRSQRRQTASRVAGWKERRRVTTRSMERTGNAVTSPLAARSGNEDGTPEERGGNDAPTPTPTPTPVQDPLKSPPDPDGVEDPAGIDAAWLLERWPAWYASVRHGARYRVKPALEFSIALQLVGTYPEREHLERMARVFLGATGLPPVHAGRTLDQFARLYAPGCDAAVRAGQTDLVQDRAVEAPTNRWTPRPADDREGTWGAVYAELQNRMARHDLVTWFGEARVVRETGDVLTVAVPERIQVDWIQRHHLAVLSDAAEAVRPGLRVELQTAVTA